MIIFKNQLTRKNKINNRIKNDLDDCNGIKDVRYLFNVEKMSNLSISDIKNIKEKLLKFKNELFNNNNKIRKDSNECKGIKLLGICSMKINDNIYKGIKDIRYLFNGIEDYYIENIKSELKKLSHNLVKEYIKNISYMVDYINNGGKLEERPINLKIVRDKFIAYSDNLPFGMLSKSSYIDFNKKKIVSSVTFDDEYKILKTESRIMIKSLRTLKMPLFWGFLRNPFIKHFNDNSLEEELLEYIELNRNKVQYV